MWCNNDRRRYRRQHVARLLPEDVTSDDRDGPSSSSATASRPGIVSLLSRAFQLDELGRTSKSAVSRTFVAATEPALAELLAADLSGLDLVALMVDAVTSPSPAASSRSASTSPAPSTRWRWSRALPRTPRWSPTCSSGCASGAELTRPVLVVIDGCKALLGRSRTCWTSLWCSAASSARSATCGIGCPSGCAARSSPGCGSLTTPTPTLEALRPARGAGPRADHDPSRRCRQPA